MIVHGLWGVVYTQESFDKYRYGMGEYKGVVGHIKVTGK